MVVGEVVGEGAGVAGGAQRSRLTGAGGGRGGNWADVRVRYSRSEFWSRAGRLGLAVLTSSSELKTSRDRERASFSGLKPGKLGSVGAARSIPPERLEFGIDSESGESLSLQIYAYAKHCAGCGGIENDAVPII